MWKFEGKTYKTVSGLCKAIAKDCGSVEIGSVGSDRTIKAYSDRTTVCATYYVDIPASAALPTEVTRIK